MTQNDNPMRLMPEEALVMWDMFLKGQIYLLPSEDADVNIVATVFDLNEFRGTQADETKS